jgi:hypothetical protein
MKGDWESFLVSTKGEKKADNHLHFEEFVAVPKHVPLPARPSSHIVQFASHANLISKPRPGRKCHDT